MKKEFAEVTVKATTLGHVLDAVISLFEKTRKETGDSRIGYVAGIIGSDGENRVDENRKILDRHTQRIRTEYDFPIFSATDIFENPDLWYRLEEIRLERPERRMAFLHFWREVLELGKVTDIFMTPRWEKSEGASDEHETAKRLGIKIHYVK
ncbi:MAG: hypothetical protein A3B38_03805 [Candidatus Levybacteria bacterium RIFCSPLOWO2_01_FULL_36_13]|nr:MAG: hypothetical protein A2684_00740 [Candidatus Levybacteria bacterium RIFCSPHIGHO2_01_FULL_36_15b]OGH34256.1 MAG: hypothetical protein A3B38_03805 [Candidatus Levybacteria bacterium RIFCSPLOWO2_01_FULL_36_13]